MPTRRPWFAAALALLVAGGIGLAEERPAASGSIDRLLDAVDAVRHFRQVALSPDGRSVAWVGPMGPGRGRATVRVDGVLAATVSQAAAHYRPRHVLFARSWPVVGRHTVQIRVVGSPGATVMIDSFSVIGEPARQPAHPATAPRSDPFPS